MWVLGQEPEPAQELALEQAVAVAPELGVGAGMGGGAGAGAGGTGDGAGTGAGCCGGVVAGQTGTVLPSTISSRVSTTRFPSASTPGSIPFDLR